MPDRKRLFAYSIVISIICILSSASSVQQTQGALDQQHDESNNSRGRGSMQVNEYSSVLSQAIYGFLSNGSRTLQQNRKRNRGRMFNPVKSVGDAAKKAGNAAGNAAKNAGNAAKKTGNAAGNAVKKTGNAAGNAAKKTGNAAKNAGNKVTGNRNNNNNRKKNNNPAKNLGNAIKDAGNAAGNAAKNAGNAAKKTGNAAGNAAKNVGNAAKNTGNKAVNAGKGAINRGKNRNNNRGGNRNRNKNKNKNRGGGLFGGGGGGIKDIVNGVGSGIKDTVDKGTEAVKDTVNKGTGAVKDTVDKGTDAINKGAGAVKDQVGKGAGAIKDQVDKGKGAGSGAAAGVIGAVGAVGGAIGGIVDNIKDDTDRAVDNVKDTVGNVQEGVSEGVGNVVEGVSEGVGNIVEGVSEGIENIQDGVTDMVDNIVEGVGSILDDFTDSSFFRGLVDPFSFDEAKRISLFSDDDEASNKPVIFDELNKNINILQGTLGLQDVACDKFEMFDIIPKFNKQSDTKSTLEISLGGFRMECGGGFQYKKGSVQIPKGDLNLAIGSLATFKFNILSENMGGGAYLPSRVSLDTCDVSSGIRLDIFGGALGKLLDPVLENFDLGSRGIMEGFFCDRMRDNDANVISKIVQGISEQFAPESGKIIDLSNPLKWEDRIDTTGFFDFKDYGLEFNSMDELKEFMNQFKQGSQEASAAMRARRQLRAVEEEEEDAVEERKLEEDDEMDLRTAVMGFILKNFGNANKVSKAIYGLTHALSNAKSIKATGASSTKKTTDNDEKYHWEKNLLDYVEIEFEDMPITVNEASIKGQNFTDFSIYPAGKHTMYVSTTMPLVDVKFDLSILDGSGALREAFGLPDPSEERRLDFFQKLSDIMPKRESTKLSLSLSEIQLKTHVFVGMNIEDIDNIDNEKVIEWNCEKFPQFRISTLDASAKINDLSLEGLGPMGLFANAFMGPTSLLFNAVVDTFIGQALDGGVKTMADQALNVGMVTAKGRYQSQFC